MGKNMVKEHTLGLMETSMRVSGRMEMNTVKGLSLLGKGNGKETSM